MNISIPATVSLCVLATTIFAQVQIGSALDVALGSTLTAEVKTSGDVVVNKQVNLTQLNFTFTGGSQTLNATAELWLGDVTMTGDISFTCPSILQVDNLTIDNTGQLTPSNDFRVMGDFVNNGSFVHGNGSVMFEGSSVQTVSGGPTAFQNIFVSNSAGVFIEDSVELYGILNVGSTGVFDADGAAGSGRFIVKSVSDDGSVGDGGIWTLETPSNFSGDVTVERFMSAEGRIYRYLSLPVTSAPVTDWQDDFSISGTFTGANAITTNPSLYYYDETQPGNKDVGWVPYPDPAGSNLDLLSPVRGYAAFIFNDTLPTIISVRGPINKGDVDAGLTFTDDSTQDDDTEDGWNLVGNPYPATIEWELIYGDMGTSNIGDFYAVRDNGGGEGIFRYYIAGGGELNGGTNQIAMGQSFWVKASVSPSLIFKETMKTSATTSFFREMTVGNFLKVALLSGHRRDESAIHFRDDATAEYDQWDIPKLWNDQHNIALKLNSKYLAVQSLAPTAESLFVPVSIWNVPTGNYSLSFERFEDLGAEAYLVDHYLGIEHDIIQDGSYSFTIDAASASSYGDSRFAIRFGPQLSLVSSKLPIEKRFSIYPNPTENYLYVELDGFSNSESVKFTAYDQLGRTIQLNVRRQSNQKFVIPLDDVSVGIYYLVLNANGEQMMRRFAKK